MFEKLVLRPASIYQPQLDLGELAEALVFYEVTRLYVREGDLAHLLAAATPTTVIDLLESGALQLTVLRDTTATHSTTRDGRTHYDFITVELVRPDRSPREPIELVHPAIEALVPIRGRARRLSKRLLRLATVARIDEESGGPGCFCDQARADLDDVQFTKTTVATVLESLLGSHLPFGWSFELSRTATGFEITTNLDLAGLGHQSGLEQRVGSPLSPALVADFIQEARFDLVLSARQRADILGSDLTRELVQKRISLALQRGREPKNEIRLFQEVVLRGRSVGDTVRSGERTLTDVLRVIEAKARFRDWVRGKPFDEGLVAAYVEAVTADSWLDRLPAKLTRFAAFSAAGAAAGGLLAGPPGLVAGLAVGAVDSFLVDPLLRGWRPSQFVDRQLKPFVR